MRKNNTAIIFGGLFFSCSVMAANGTLAPTVVPMVNGGQASIAISNTSPNLFTVPGDRIIAVNSLDGALTNNEQTASGGVVVATVNKKPFTFILETERGLNLSIQAVPREGAGRTIQLVSEPDTVLDHRERVRLFIQIQFPHGSDWSEVLRLTDIVTEKVSSGRTAGGHHHRHTGYTWSVSVN
ncbi:TraK domain-containing protein [Escherichia coli]|uniref:TraK domain-containing protein n=1 Tax=Escherichia coli TaxID=562 RepID=UPI00266719C0|nr:type-F conjugative transfer system secretin TraK [Escherichia coli]MDO2624963.1 type-F conjugative transfer system secretin TraK [Escherichia coli]MDO2797133.1 type-F conjugative transfer system secretin TraK [Escherichia coli]